MLGRCRDTRGHPQTPQPGDTPRPGSQEPPLRSDSGPGSLLEPRPLSLCRPLAAGCRAWGRQGTSHANRLPSATPDTLPPFLHQAKEGTARTPWPMGLGLQVTAQRPLSCCSRSGPPGNSTRQPHPATAPAPIFSLTLTWLIRNLAPRLKALSPRKTQHPLTPPGSATSAPPPTSLQSPTWPSAAIGPHLPPACSS